MQIGFTSLYTSINPPTPTIRFTVRWLVGARWKGCPLRRDFCIAQGDDIRFIGRAFDFNGDLQDLNGVQDIVFAIYDRRGGTEISRLSMSDTEIYIGAPEEFFFNLRTGVTMPLDRRRYWHETLIVNSDGWRNTVLHGSFEVQQTNIGALT